MQRTAPMTQNDLAPNGNSAEVEKCWSQDLNSASQASLWPKTFFFCLFSAVELLLLIRTTNRKVTCSHAYLVRFDKNLRSSWGQRFFPLPPDTLDPLMSGQKEKHSIIILPQGISGLFSHIISFFWKLFGVSITHSEWVLVLIWKQCWDVHMTKNSPTDPSGHHL